MTVRRDGRKNKTLIGSSAEAVIVDHLSHHAPTISVPLLTNSAPAGPTITFSQHVIAMGECHRNIQTRFVVRLIRILGLWFRYLECISESLPNLSYRSNQTTRARKRNERHHLLPEDGLVKLK